MSRGFVREDDQEEAPFVPPRAPLPQGVPNHVTPRGLRLLQEERAALEADRSKPYESENAKRRAWAEIDGRLELLNERLGSARVVEPPDPAPDDVRFGAAVSFRFLKGPQAGQDHTFHIVGVDEASVKEGRIAFVAPIARALLGKRPGEIAAFALGTMQQELEVLAVTYD
ncbi:MAG: GreA/GreB family elongation factor [Flavobacteriales bacterium]|nr:GreA/GreB family elongation factor [Flavobacteriales bacterium]MBK9286132.1 GreA/GreB family elongation factor [Flavobacteriales bacterium]MBL0034507.1 GreA/GreB family elongation factor [Flavobacteriales bacterium]